MGGDPLRGRHGRLGLATGGWILKICLFVDGRGLFWASQVVLVVMNLSANAGNIRDAGLILGSGRSPGEENGNPSPVFLPGESHGQRSWLATVHRSQRAGYE